MPFSHTPRLSLEDIARDANAFAQSTILYSNTHPNFDRYNDDKRHNIADRIQLMRWRTDSETDIFCWFRKSDLFQAFEATVKLCMRSAIRNCMEFTFLALYYITLNYPMLKIEGLEIAGGDHFFMSSVERKEVI